VKHRALLALTLALVAACAATGGAPGPRAPGESAPSRHAEATPNPVADAIDRYRQSRGLPAIPRSAWLTRVARAHVADLEANHRAGGRCNMHSWSPHGDWTPCCYTPDHAQAACMWDKPQEISHGRYAAPGYEIVAHYTDAITPAIALEIWQQSPGHHAMVLNSGRWADNTWRAMGAAMGTHYAVVWFAEASDPAGDRAAPPPLPAAFSRNTDARPPVMVRRLVVWPW
jgi:hypothetical protein